MKKLLLATCIGLMLCAGLPALAADCKGGTTFTGKNGKTYCGSTATMNWYTAFAWCKRQGAHVPTMNELCDTDTFTHPGGFANCQNIAGKSSGDAWTATPNGDGSACSVSLPDGNVGSGNGTSTDRAVCVW